MTRTLPDSQSPRLAEKLLVAFTALGMLGNITSYWNGEIFWSGPDPYAAYHHNLGIRAIEIAAAALGLCIVLLLIPAFQNRPLASPTARLVRVLCLAAAVLPYLELWWGSTFYYGEVRDKQGLPFGVSYGGPTGTAVFVTYVISRSGAPLGTGWRRRLLLLGAWAGLIWLQVQGLKLLEGPWNLGQS